MTSTPPDPILTALNDNRLLTIEGPNFSGRTSLLRRFCRNKSDARMYLGPEIYFALSGLTTTVRQELELHTGGPLENKDPKIKVPGTFNSEIDHLHSVQQLGLTHLLDHHPASLSGGEQTALAILCAIILKPTILAADCALEQLDNNRLAACLDLLKSPVGPHQGAIITDNRLDEWTYPIQSAPISSFPTPASKHPAVPALNPAELDTLDPITGPTIELKNIHAGYKKSPDVLTDISLTLHPGKIFTLTGPNGSGKSTFAKVLSGVLRPTAGQINVNAKPSTPWKTPGKIAGYHLQNPDVGLFESTVTAELGKSPHAPATLRSFGLTPYADSNPLALPFPLRKRVSLAATIAHRPPWIILDEPTLGSDTPTVEALAQIIQKLADKGHGLLIISHSKKLLKILNATPLALSDGRIAAAN